MNRKKYLDDVGLVASLDYDYHQLDGKTLMVSGATGLIGHFLIDVLAMRNRRYGNDIHIIALGRNSGKAGSLFEDVWNDGFFKFIECDINKPLAMDLDVDYIFHAASTTHPVAYATDPVGTITSNIIGSQNLLEYGVHHGLKRFIFASSVEIYGENRGDVEKFKEDYLGYIDSNTLRAGYPEGKRVGEALCQAYRRQYGIETVSLRLARTFGPTMLKSDTKAISQFISKALAGEDIVLKSEGYQNYSYTYVADAVSAVILSLLSLKDGEAYNVANSQCDITLRDLSSLIASKVGRKVVFELPDEKERLGYSKATKALMDPEKLISAGWHPLFNIDEAVSHTLEILSD